MKAGEFGKVPFCKYKLYHYVVIVIVCMKTLHTHTRYWNSDTGLQHIDQKGNLVLWCNLHVCIIYHALLSQAKLREHGNKVYDNGTITFSIDR